MSNINLYHDINLYLKYIKLNKIIMESLKNPFLQKHSKYINIAIFIIIILFIVNLIILISQIFYAIYKFYILERLDLIERYGKDSYVIITGASSGQGKEFALQFAELGFNLFLIGSKRLKSVEYEINHLYPNCHIIIEIVNFSNAADKNFFTPIEKIVNMLDVSLLINNIGHRTGWLPYHNTPMEKINDTIVCGTIVQTQMTRLFLNKIQHRRNNRSGIIFITAQCIHSNLFVNYMTNTLSLPYLSVYEASNAFGFFHAKSIIEEYKDYLDILNITPGAVVTQNTDYLKNVMFNIDSKSYVNNVLTLLGNVNGTSFGSFGHEMSNILTELFPFIKKPILKNVGKTIAQSYMQNYQAEKNKYNI